MVFESESQVVSTGLKLELVDENDLELLSFLSLPPKYWVTVMQNHILFCTVLRVEFRASCKPGKDPTDADASPV